MGDSSPPANGCFKPRMGGQALVQQLLQAAAAAAGTVTAATTTASAPLEQKQMVSHVWCTRRPFGGPSLVGSGPFQDGPLSEVWEN